MERTGTGIRERVSQVEADSFNETHLFELAKAELGNGPNVSFFRFWMFGPKGGQPLPKPDHFNYLSWRIIFDKYASTPQEMAELIAIDGNAIVRIRDRSGKITKRILTGKDPLQIEIEGERFEIVYIAGFQTIDIYARTVGALTPEKGIRVYTAIEHMFPGISATVYLRNDSLFVYERTFPYWNPFEELPMVPSEEQYARTRTLMCGHQSGAVSCSF